MLPNDIGEGTTQGLLADGEADSIVPNKVVILSNGLRYIQYLEGRNQRLHQENIAFGLARIMYAWGIITGIVSDYL